jgi:hypothetical protein
VLLLLECGGRLFTASAQETNAPVLSILQSVEIAWGSEDNKLYQVQWSANGEDWKYLWWRVTGNCLPGTGGTLRVNDRIGPETTRLYRVLALDATGLEELVAAIVNRARANDVSFFETHLRLSSKDKAGELVAMVLRSGMLDNFRYQIEPVSPRSVRLDYHYLERGCHFQIELRLTQNGWDISGMEFCR